MDAGLSDRELFPLLDAQGAAMLKRLREHPHAPRYNWRTGERLTAEGLERVRIFAAGLRAPTEPWQPGRPPGWVAQFVATCREQVPFYREHLGANFEFAALPLLQRDEVRRIPWAFVPDGQAVEELIAYTTSGTTGARLWLPATPELPVRYLPLFEFALESVGVKLEGGSRVAIVHVCAQRPTVVLCSLSTYLGGAGFAKINLDPGDWHGPEDARHFLEDCDAEIYTGDPFAFWRLMQMPLSTKPKAMLSGAMALPAGLRRRLQTHFGCPVLDVYSMNETGPIAYSAVDGVHASFPHQIYIEILDERQQPCPAHQLGQIVITGGLNPCLPLVRYATGDYAAWSLDNQQRVQLERLHGRAPVAFRNAAGEWFNSIDASTLLSDSGLPDLMLHQHADGLVTMRSHGEQAALEAAHTDIAWLFGAGMRVEMQRETGEMRAGKPLRFSSDLQMPMQGGV